MHGVESVHVACPSCGESVELLIDCSISAQRYIEDCEVCCRPMNVFATADETGIPVVQVSK